ncbi:MAG: SRPBCC domain-containing protein [Bacteroidales bacterium]
MEKITIKAMVNAPKQKVWDYYTQPQHITKWNFADPSWHCPRATIDLKIGGRYLARMEAKDGSFGFDFDAVYIEILEGENFTYEIGGRLATVEFEEINGQTEVTITFDPETVHPIEMQRNGWQSIIKTLYDDQQKTYCRIVSPAGFFWPGR